MSLNVVCFRLYMMIVFCYFNMACVLQSIFMRFSERLSCFLGDADKRVTIFDDFHTSLE